MTLHCQCCYQLSFCHNELPFELSVNESSSLNSNAVWFQYVSFKENKIKVMVNDDKIIIIIKVRSIFSFMGLS